MSWIEIHIGTYEQTGRANANGSGLAICIMVQTEVFGESLGKRRQEGKESGWTIYDACEK